MKKILPLLLILIMTACSREPVQQPREIPAADNYYTVCDFISGSMQTGEKGLYELLRHTDGSAEIIYTDISAATRKALGKDTTVQILHETVTGIFVRDGYLYHYSHGAPQAMKKPEETAVLYQYDMDGQLLQYTETGKNIELDMDSAVVTDGQWLYISGSELLYENSRLTGSTSHIFAINHNSLEIKKVYTPRQADIDIIGGYSHYLITDVEYSRTDRHGNRECINRIELLDMKNFERHSLSAISVLWHNMCDGKLYKLSDTKGNIKIFDLEKMKETSVTVIKDSELLKDHNISVNFITDRYAFIAAESYRNGICKNFIYDFEENTLTAAPDFCDLPCAYAEESGYYIVSTGYEKIPVAEGFYSVYDIHYALISTEDYHSGTENLIPIKNEIDYR